MNSVKAFLASYVSKLAEPSKLASSIISMLAEVRNAVYIRVVSSASNLLFDKSRLINALAEIRNSLKASFASSDDKSMDLARFRSFSVFTHSESSSALSKSAVD